MDEGLYRQWLERQAAGQPTALAIVVATKGSTPQQPGAKALFGADGSLSGTIGGGCLEHEVRLRALDCLRTGQAELVKVDLTGDWDQDTGLICGGLADVLVVVPGPADAPLIRTLSEASAARTPAALVYDLAEPGRLAVITGDGRADGPADLQATGRAALAGEAVQPASYVDLLRPPERLWIAGAGHVGRAVARHAAVCGFEVVVVDDRPDLCSPEALPEAHRHEVGEIAAVLAAAALGSADYVVIVTRGHRHDAAALRAVIGSGARYIGLIGSRRKIKLIAAGLLAEGAATAEQLARVYAPIGLDIGAVTVDEIAVCIVAELIAVRRGRLTDPGDRLSRHRGSRAGCPAAGEA